MGFVTVTATRANMFRAYNELLFEEIIIGFTDNDTNHAL